MGHASLCRNVHSNPLLGFHRVMSLSVIDSLSVLHVNPLSDHDLQVFPPTPRAVFALVSVLGGRNFNLDGVPSLYFLSLAVPEVPSEHPPLQCPLAPPSPPALAAPCPPRLGLGPLRPTLSPAGRPRQRRQPPAMFNAGRRWGPGGAVGSPLGHGRRCVPGLEAATRRAPLSMGGSRAPGGAARDLPGSLL